MEGSKCYVYDSFVENRQQCKNVENEETKLFLLGNEPNNKVGGCTIIQLYNYPDSRHEILK